jgi:hypothetical protein
MDKRTNCPLKKTDCGLGLALAFWLGRLLPEPGGRRLNAPGSPPQLTVAAALRLGTMSLPSPVRKSLQEGLGY